MPHSSMEKDPELSASRISSLDVNANAWMDLALSASSVLGSITRRSVSAKMASVVATAIVFRGTAAVRRPKTAACSKAGMMVRF